MTVYGTDTEYDADLVARVQREKVGKLSVHRNGLPSRKRRFNVITDLGLNHNLGVYNNNVDAIVRALTERTFFFPDKKNGGFRRALNPINHAFHNKHFRTFRESVLQHMPTLPRLSLQAVTERYSGGKRKIYEAALDSLKRKPLNDEDAKLNMFVKFEKQDLSKAPRVINPRSARYNLELGRYLKHAEKLFFKAINKAFGSITDHTVIKGLNAIDSATVLKAKWDRFVNPVGIGLDAEKFDGHTDVQALKYEHSFYRASFPGAKLLGAMLDAQLKNRGVAYADDGKVKFEIRGTRCSGDLNTSLGNCLIMCAAVFVYAAQKNITVELANNGDDCVVIMEREHEKRFMAGLTAWFSDRGYSMVCEEPVYEFEQIEFCQTHPVNMGDCWKMVRNHGAVLRKDPMCLIPVPNENVLKMWMDAVGTGGGILAAGVPVQQAFYNVFKRNGSKCTDAMFDHIYRNTSMNTKIAGLHEPVDQEVLDITRVSYYYAFGITPDQQIEIEKYYKNMLMDAWNSEPTERHLVNIEPGLRLLEYEISW